MTEFSPYRLKGNGEGQAFELGVSVDPRRGPLHPPGALLPGAALVGIRGR